MWRQKLLRLRLQQLRPLQPLLQCSQRLPLALGRNLQLLEGYRAPPCPQPLCRCEGSRRGTCACCAGQAWHMGALHVAGVAASLQDCQGQSHLCSSGLRIHVCGKIPSNQLSIRLPASS